MLLFVAVISTFSPTLLWAETLDAAVAKQAWKALARVEKRHGIPSGLLHSMSLVETGQGMEGMVMPWPYTVGVNSPGRKEFSNKSSALAGIQKYYRLGFRRFDITLGSKEFTKLNALSVRSMLASTKENKMVLYPRHFGQRFPTARLASRFTHKLLQNGYDNIDIGLMQVNWRFHKENFESVDEAFDPATNADYAVTYLKKHRETRDWWGSVGRYHSGTKKYAKRYIKNVWAMYQRVHRLGV